MFEVIEVVDINTPVGESDAAIVKLRGDGTQTLPCKIVNSQLFGEFERDMDGQVRLDQTTGMAIAKKDEYGNDKIGPLVLEWVPNAILYNYDDGEGNITQYSLGAWVASSGEGGVQTGNNHYHDAFLIRKSS